MILIAPCICKPSNVMKDVSAWKRLCQSVNQSWYRAGKSRNGTGGADRAIQLASYVIHVYEVRPLRRVIEHRVILLNEALADRLVRHVHRHGAVSRRLRPATMRQKSDPPFITRRLRLRMPPRTFRLDLEESSDPAVPTSAKRRRATSLSLVSCEQETGGGRGDSSRDTSKTAGTSRTFGNGCTPPISRSASLALALGAAPHPSPFDRGKCRRSAVCAYQLTARFPRQNTRDAVTISRSYETISASYLFNVWKGIMPRHRCPLSLSPSSLVTIKIPDAYVRFFCGRKCRTNR